MKQVLFLGAFATIAVMGIYYLITFYDDNQKLARMINTVVIRPHEEPLLIMEKGLVPYKGGEALTAARIKNKSLLQSDQPFDKLVATGKEEYRVFCSHCHGTDMDGQGTVGQSFNPLPTDLTSEVVAQKSDGDLFLHISQGGGRAPALATSMTENSRWAVISYIRFKQASK